MEKLRKISLLGLGLLLIVSAISAAGESHRTKTTGTTQSPALATTSKTAARPVAHPAKQTTSPKQAAGKTMSTSAADPWQGLKSCLQRHPLFFVQNGGGILDLTDHAIRHYAVWSRLHAAVANFDLDPSRQQATADLRDYLKQTQGSGETMEQAGPLLYQFSSGATHQNRQDISACAHQVYGT